MNIFLIGLFCSLATSSAQAHLRPATSFFRSPQSLFPSGQASPQDLQSSQKEEFTVSFYQVKKDKAEFRMAASQVLRDLDLSIRAQDVKTGEIGVISQAAPPWYQFLDRKNKRTWKTPHELIPAADDLGLAATTKCGPLRKTPAWKSDTIMTMPEAQKMRVLGFEGEFVKVQSLENSDLIGYLELAHVILKFDFASFVLTPAHDWKPFHHREQDSVVLANKTRLPLSQIKAMRTRPELGVLQAPDPDHGLVPRSTVELGKHEWVRWVQSDLRGHGLIYWKKEERMLDSRSAPTALSTEEVLSRDFFSVGLHPKDPQEALVSASGVFFTHDGKSWSKFDSFADANLPVAISEKGELFVGGFRSEDQGQSFHSYLRWQDLTMILEARHRRTPGQLRISEIKPLDQNQILITVETGTWKTKLQGSRKYGLVTDWQVVSEH